MSNNDLVSRHLGPLRWLGPLGSGKYSVCHHVKSADGKSFALKIPERKDSHSQDELELLRSVKPHPNVVQLHEELQQGLLLDFAGHIDAHSYERKHRPLSEPICSELLHQALKGLRSLHEQGWLHRDVKLENMVLDCSSSPPQLKLCDFGFAVRRIHASKRRHWVGTPLYSAPELLRHTGSRYSCMSDAWAIGVCAYRLLFCRWPYTASGDNAQAKLFEKLRNAEWPEPPAQPQRSPAALSLCKSLLRRDRKHRCSVKEALQCEWIVL